MSRAIGDTLLSHGEAARSADGRPLFWIVKRTVDIAVSLIALPLLVPLAATLLALNPLANPGPLLFRQVRMGRDRRAFTIVKFRTMRPRATPTRGPDDPLERALITPLGRWLRILRLDEMPQLVSVLRGDMSLIGPRPDEFSHALAYLEAVPGYRERLSVRPGLSGLAQIEVGYTEGVGGAAQKVRKDLQYISQIGWRLECSIALRTPGAIWRGIDQAGAREAARVGQQCAVTPGTVAGVSAMRAGSAARVCAIRPAAGDGHRG